MLFFFKKTKAFNIELIFFNVFRKLLYYIKQVIPSFSETFRPRLKPQL